jgi:integrase/recombinase XerD
MKVIAMNPIQRQENKTTQQAFDEFTRYCKIRNLSNHTIFYYERSLEQFTKVYPANQPIKDISKDTIEDFILYLRENTNCNSVSINSHLRGIRVFLKYCMELGYLNTFKIELIKAEKKIKETYSDEELQLLLQKPDVKNCRFTEFRNWALVNYLLATANRISTVVNVRIGDLDFEGGYIIMSTTKNKKQQIIPMSQALREVLTEYLKYRKGGQDDYLFPTQWGQQMSVDSVKSAVKRYNQSRGVMKTSCHLFRNTFSKKYILSGGDIFRLQKILGHSDLTMVRQYVDMFSDDLQKDFNTLNPLDQLVENKTPITMKRGGRR